MPLTLQVTEDLAKLTAAIGDIGKRHIPRSEVIALTRTMSIAKQDERDAMQRELDRPTPWALNGLQLRPATFTNPTAELWLKEFAPKGTPAINFLSPEIYGGERRQKRFERALQFAGLMPQGMWAMPGAAAPRDAYGNVPGPFIVKMLSQLQAFGEQGYRANESARTHARRVKRNPNIGDFFVVLQQRGKLKPGIWQRMHFAHGNAAKPIFIYTRTPPKYTKRYRFFETAQATILREFPRQFQIAFDEAMQRFGA